MPDIFPGASRARRAELILAVVEDALLTISRRPFDRDTRDSVWALLDALAEAKRDMNAPDGVRPFSWSVGEDDQ